MRDNEAITWLLSDHLGSTSVTVDASGSLLGSLKFTAYGELRSGSSTTDYQYTGQRNEVEIGLYYYVARMYDPQLARFISADTIVPEAGNAKAYDRYMYVNGNPVNFNDPSGHRLTECGLDSQDCGGSGSLVEIISQELNDGYTWSFSGNWTLAETKVVSQAAHDIEKYIETFGGNGQEWIRIYLGGVTFAKEQIVSLYYPNLGISINELLNANAFVFPSNRITFRNSFDIDSGTVVHELGHTLDNLGGPSKVFEAAIFGGGWSDGLIVFLGGTPYGVRCAAPHNLLDKVALPDGDYGNKHQADFFANHFRYQVYGYPEGYKSGPADMWMRVFVELTVNMLP